MSGEIRQLLFAAIVALSASEACGQQTNPFMSGTQLTQVCNGGDIDSALSCRSYLMGVIDGISTVSVGMVGRNALCIPPNVTIEQIRLIVVRELQTHPESLHYTPASLIYKAIDRAFPCN